MQATLAQLNALPLKVKAFSFSLAVMILAELLLSPLSSVSGPSAAVARAAVVFITIYSISRFTLQSCPLAKQRSVDIFTGFLALVLFAVLTWTGFLVTKGLSAAFPELKVSSIALLLGVPYSVGGLILQVVLGFRYSLLYTLSTVVLTILYIPKDATLLATYTLVTTFVGCLSLAQTRSRSAFFTSALKIGALTILFGLASILYQEAFLMQEVFARLIGVGIVTLATFLLATGFMPIVEYIGGYVTDIRLLEMATLDHPLLKDLSVHAPGTWNHSMAMGMMAEAAADAIGANSVVARVGAYFHDIGKIKKPLYFIENQLPGDNRHDKLSPSMSALIIRAHVKDGVELSKKYALPQILIDMIEQHHGTSLIEFFHEKALKEAELQTSGAIVDVSHYTYPGPKPQTREAGILMLADGIEAASRLLEDPTSDRIQGMVQKKINKVFTSGQLSECEITLRDLHVIAKSFTRVLVGIHHHRINYGEPVEKTARSPLEVGGENMHASMSDDSQDEKPEQIRRLGLVASDTTIRRK